jgi:ABC-type Fe3+/spermidine/putrescine transport system ATPase subunit
MSIATKPASLQFDRIQFTYPGGKQIAIDDVNIDVKPGELVVLVGPSGCGKSTLLRIAAGLIIPSSGSLIIDGEDALKLPPEKRGIGWVPQSYALFEHLNIAENVGFGLKMQKVPKAEREQQVAEMMKLCRIEEMAKRSVRALSGGQRQRVAIARALAVRPRVLLLDEPLAALDPQLRIAIRADLEELLRESGVTTLFVTHDQSEAIAIADKVVVLRNGKVEQIDTPDRLWNYPANEFVAAFLSNALIGTAMTIDTRVVEFADKLTCRINRDATIGQEVKLALRKDNFELAPDGVAARIVFSEYNGGVYNLKVQTDSGVVIPVCSIEELAVGTAVMVNSKKDTEIAVVGV